MTMARKFEGSWNRNIPTATKPRETHAHDDRCGLTRKWCSIAVMGSFASNATRRKDGSPSPSANMYKSELTRYNTAGTEIAIYSLQSDENSNFVGTGDVVKPFDNAR